MDIPCDFHLLAQGKALNSSKDGLYNGHGRDIYPHSARKTSAFLTREMRLPMAGTPVAAHASQVSSANVANSCRSSHP